MANTNGNNDIEGFLYTPDLPEGSACINRTAQYIPQNATRRADLPDATIHPPLIALAPWAVPECVLPLFDAVNNSVTAFIFYIPGSPMEIPPPVSDPIWGLGDGGSWKKTNKFPVYAIPGPQGSSIMTQLGQYSGAISNVPNGSLLQEQLRTSSLARMYSIVELAGTTSLPSLWAFLLIVLGIVLFLVGFTSGVMHLYQRRRRSALRRRIVHGDVDLERLGIKRLTVPQEAIDMLPRFPYNPSEKQLLDRPTDHITALSDFPIKDPDADPAAASKVSSLPSPTETSESALPVQQDPSIPASSLSRHPSPPPTSSPSMLLSSNQPSYAQPTCPICLDDFVPQHTIVRSLPCHHIYHPECIDPFLLKNSSLCPVCKSKVLPKGYCPATITNAMVRRERQQRRNRDRMRRLRGEEAAAQVPVAALVEPRRGSLLAVQGRTARFRRQFGRAGRSASAANAQPSSAIEMRNRDGEEGDTTSAPPPPPPPPESTNLVSEAVPSSPQPANPAPTTSSPPSSSTEHALPNPTSPTTPEPRSERARRRASLFLRAQGPTAEDEERERLARLPKCGSTSLSPFFLHYIATTCRQWVMLMLAGDRAESDQDTVPWLLNGEKRFSGIEYIVLIGRSVYLLLEPPTQPLSGQEDKRRRCWYEIDDSACIPDEAAHKGLSSRETL
ncbi:MAG: hypothetical protein Q9208_004395 [Pyrenodesmia sp. 3 TL-2023]